MAYPLIIFGAGASFDYSPEDTRKRISPLTKNLADSKFLFPDLLKKYEGVGDLLSGLVHQVRNNKETFESALSKIQERSSGSDIMQSKFVALEFYLQDLFQRISNVSEVYNGISKEEKLRVSQINNYRVIISHLNTYTKGTGCIVTFNYDSLFENNLPKELKPIKIEDYIQNKLKLIKLHGSHDWRYIHRKSDIIMTGIYIDKNTETFELFMKYPDLFKKIQANEKYTPYHIDEINGNSRRNEFHTLPALAIPIIGKDKYICHPKHIEILRQELPNVDRVLIVGWRAKDPLLLEMLQQRLPKDNCKILIISNTKAGADAIKKTIWKIVKINNDNIETRGGGFSNFIANEISHTFFSDK